MCITCRWENKRILEFSSQNIEIEQNLNRADFSSVILRTRACVYLCSRMMWADSINHLIPKVIDLLCKSHRDSHESPRAPNAPSFWMCPPLVSGPAVWHPDAIVRFSIQGQIKYKVNLYSCSWTTRTACRHRKNLHDAMEMADSATIVSHEHGLI